MQRILPATALAAAAFLAPAVQAQDLSIYTGVAVTSDYIARGFNYSDGPAIQSYIEAEIGGFYAGLWASSVGGNAVNANDDVEIDAYLGFRNQIGSLSYDIGYVRYLYDDSGDCCGEFLFSMGTALESGLNLGLDLAYNHTESVSIASMSGGYALSDLVNVSAEAGRVSGTHNFWNAGATFAATDTVGVDLRYHDSGTESGRFVGSVSFDLQLR